ncbi:hypothetical protein [Lentibacillus salicampi]|uniref:Uncharacterized protein n=1 Tax=Lentibacillus salicampi TaxID=175306 RepID=A0A4Y9A8J7_9BACI|nr:hypothetical protein [Lentibacillus salicampi]TFJ92159.1 hypothetical protein E4U82_13855 [Lentibacillus salicampi]
MDDLKRVIKNQKSISTSRLKKLLQDTLYTDITSLKKQNRKLKKKVKRQKEALKRYEKANQSDQSH